MKTEMSPEKKANLKTILIIISIVTGIGIAVIVVINFIRAHKKKGENSNENLDAEDFFDDELPESDDVEADEDEEVTED